MNDDILESPAPRPISPPKMAGEVAERQARTREVLGAAVRHATGLPHAEPRPGQIMLVDDLAAAAAKRGPVIGGFASTEHGGHVLGAAPTGVGKALDIDTPIPTPDGWKKMGDLVAGDWVFSEHGEPIRVLGAYDVQYDRPCFELKFSDDSTIVADGEHLWTTSTRQRRAVVSDDLRASKRYTSQGVRQPREELFQTVTTEQIAATLTGQGDASNHALPISGALKTMLADLPVDPYVLGAWLGDGTSNSTQITSADEEIIEQIRSRGFEVRKLTAKYLFGISVPGWSQKLDSPKGLTAIFRDLGVLKNKHIPDLYLRASYEQRLELLRGIIDTDGTISPRGRVEIAVVSEQLARDIHELVRSLGFVSPWRFGPAEITEADPDRPGHTRRRNCGTRYRVGFTTTLRVAHLSRKADRLPAAVQDRYRTRYITAVTPVASRPVRCIRVDNTTHLFLAGEGMVPTHNTLSALSTAAVGVVEHDERWLISTESIALQAQYVDKDGPVISAAAEEVLGRPVTVAQLKGWSNYVCAVKTRSTAAEITGREVSHNPDKAADSLPKRSNGSMEIDGRPVDGNLMLPLLDWALRQHGNDEEHGDRGHYPGSVTEAEWAQVSVSPSECIGPSDCPLVAICKPDRARQNAAEADIVVTNHSMLAVQASAGVPVVIGNKTLGAFQGLIVDEAHALPGIVRSQGQSEVSGRRIIAVSRAVTKVCSDRDAAVKKWVSDGQIIADEVDRELADNIRGGQVTKVAETQDPLANTGGVIEAWLKKATDLVKGASRSNMPPAERIAANRAMNVVDQAARDLDSVREHRVGVARWFEKTGGGPARRDWAAVQAAPVQVGGLMARNLYVERTMEDGEEYAEPLTVAAISATLPEGFAREAGLNTQMRKYPSPFDAAYGSSMLYIPRAVDASDVAAITARSKWNGRDSFDTGKHAEWAAAIMRQLVEANGGSALVLSSTVTAGKAYAEALRAQARGRFQVLSQWDGENVRVLTQRWREDPRAVMVGTRSLMTGVDAPGETCTLVIVDRAPRSASNPVDDARVEILTEAIGDKWTADRLVYVADAALLLEQAVGRLIRSMGDSGMAAVLDPRMLNAGPYKYQTPTRNAYQRAFERFTNKTSSLDTALSYLRDRAAGSNRDA